MLLHGTLCTTCLLLCILMILQCENLWDVSCMYKSVSGSVSPPLESEGDVFPSGYGSRDSIIRAGPKRDWKRLRPIKRTDSCSSWDQGHIRVEVGPEKQQAAFGLSGGAAMRCSTLLAIFTGVILYLVLGAVVFRALETPLEKHEHTKLLETLQNTSLDFQLNNACVDFDKLQEFLQKVANDLGADINVIGNTTFATKWDIASALFFSGTIITTIGYGHISPQTDGGKLFCIFYALVGIPMFGILLAGVGDHLGTALRKTVARIENLFLKWRVSPTIVRVISAVLSILLGCLLFVAVPILIFQKVEDWTLLESAYFVVITLTTVGFGDYVAGDRSQVDPNGGTGEDHKDKLDYLWRVHMYQPLVWFWILLGLAYFASILTMIGNWLRVLSKKTRAEMEELRAHATDWTQNIQNMSVDFRIPGKIDDPFRRRRRKHRHGHRSKGHSVSANGAPKGDGAEDQQESESESGSYSSYSSDESESETDSQATQTDRVPEEKNGGPKMEEAPPLTHLSQPLDYFGENLAFIDESSDAQSGKLHLDPLVDPKQPSSRLGKRRRHRRPVHRRGSKMSGSNNKQQPNGSAKPVSDLPPKPQE